MSDQNICTRCKAALRPDETFCKNCGSLFSDAVVCFNHNSVFAAGVCVICLRAFCKKCGGDSKGPFLCNVHWEYEVQEGMARVFGSMDNVQTQYVTSCLEQAGFHPFLYSRGFNPGAGIVSSWYRVTIRNYGKYPNVELKVLVPFSEVIEAERILKQLNIQEIQSP